MPKKTNRYKIYNSIIPTKPSISESDKAEMEEFILNIKILTNTLGHKVFEKKRKINSSVNKNSIFYIDATRGANATGEPTSEGFVIFKGSKVANTEVNSLTPSFKKLRNRLKESGTIKICNDGDFITEDYVASSPSTAAVIVMGRNANGLTEWKLKDGTTLREFESAD